LVLALGLAPAIAGADDDRTRLARELANPLATLISMPLQWNHDTGIGPADAGRSVLNLQPVVPLSLGGRWRLISRTVLPLVDQEAPAAGIGGARGPGDLTESLFLTPELPTAGGWRLGAGPVVQLPTGSEEALSTGHWSAGPTAIALRQVGPWSYGALANHLWSIAGDERRADVSSTFFQPFVSYVTPTHTTFALNAETSYDWSASTASVPLHLTVSQLLKVGPAPVSLFVGARYWAESPDRGPDGWGLRFGVTLLFRNPRDR
jgi:hypothetical protein